MGKKRKLILIGDSVFAQVAYEYFTHDSDYEVVAFSVESAFLTRECLMGLPVVPFETMCDRYPPAEHHIFAAIVFTQLNGLRTRLYLRAKSLGYAPAAYVSSHAVLRTTCEIGEHCFICESVVIQPFANIGNNVIVWSGTHIGHHTVVEANCFILPHAVVSNYVEIRENCVIGPNATVLDHTMIARNTVIGIGEIVGLNKEPPKV